MKKADPSYSRYYMHSANALAPEFEEEVVVRPQTVARPQKKTKPHLKITLSDVTHLACAFVLAMALVGQYIYIQGLGYDVSQSKAELDGVLAQNERLKQEYASASSLESIETYAVSSLGMVQPGENVAYLPKREHSGSTQDAVQQQAAEETAEKAQGGVVAMIEGIADRFGF